MLQKNFHLLSTTYRIILNWTSNAHRLYCTKSFPVTWETEGTQRNGAE